MAGLYTLTDDFNHKDSMVFSGTLAGQRVRIMVTAVRADGSLNFTVELAGSRVVLTGQMMSGMSQWPVRSVRLF